MLFCGFHSAMTVQAGNGISAGWHGSRTITSEYRHRAASELWEANKTNIIYCVRSARRHRVVSNFMTSEKL